MLLPIISISAPGRTVRGFGRDRRGSAAVEFAIVAPVFFALIFAIIETALVFFAGQVLETAVQDSGRTFFTSTAMSKSAYETAVCDRVKALMDCTKLRNDVQTYAAGVPFTIADPIDANGKFVDSFSYNPPATTDTTSTVVVRAFYQWPLFVTGLGYNIANINRGGTSQSRLLTATAAFRPQ